MAKHVHKDETGRVIEVRMDEKITDPEHPLAVQIPEEADGSNDHPLSPLLEPSPNDLAEAAAQESEEKNEHDEDQDAA